MALLIGFQAYKPEQLFFRDQLDLATVSREHAPTASIREQISSRDNRREIVPRRSKCAERIVNDRVDEEEPRATYLPVTLRARDLVIPAASSISDLLVLSRPPFSRKVYS